MSYRWSDGDLYAYRGAEEYEDVIAEVEERELAAREMA